MYDIRGADGTGTSASPVANDSANAKAYTIRKLADGNCWMTENLALPLALDTPVEASYNDGAIFTYIPSNTSGHEGINASTVTPRVSSDAWNGYYYYNWYAATAEKGTSSSTANVDGSICPAGWKIPYSTSYQTLTNFYSTPAQLAVNPPSFPVPGYYGNGTLYNGGNFGFYWSSTPVGWTDPSSAFHMYYGPSAIIYAYGGNKAALGNSVRCLAVR